MTHTIHHGDCLEVMAEMPESSIDAIVTDPPYGLGFMGRKWDALPPGREWAEECLRVLKPGGYLLAFGGTRTWHRLAVAIEDAGLEIKDSIAWMHGQGFPKGKASLKPAHEPVVVARKKPKPGEGLLNIDACRIHMSQEDADFIRKTARPNTAGQKHVGHVMNRPEAPTVNVHPSGRWPANVILDEHMAGALDQQSGNLPKSGGARRRGAKSDGVTGWKGGEGPASTDSGGASRFFYVAKASKRERPDVDGIKHPTVKPLALMRWLVRLVTPPNGIVLDPFAGSGTTIEAAMLEGFQVIGIEREAEYLPLIHQRIRRATEQLKTEQQQQAEAPDQGAFPLEDIA